MLKDIAMKVIHLEVEMVKEFKLLYQINFNQICYALVLDLPVKGPVLETQVDL